MSFLTALLDNLIFENQIVSSLANSRLRQNGDFCPGPSHDYQTLKLFWVTGSGVLRDIEMGSVVKVAENLNFNGYQYEKDAFMK